MKFEIKIRVTARETGEFETSALALAYARQRVEKASATVEAALLSVIQTDPPLVDRPCPGCQPINRAPILALSAPTHDDDGREIEIYLWPRDPNAPQPDCEPPGY
jgi:hypothetical protein